MRSNPFSIDKSIYPVSICKSQPIFLSHGSYESREIRSFLSVIARTSIQYEDKNGHQLHPQTFSDLRRFDDDHSSPLFTQQSEGPHELDGNAERLLVCFHSGQDWSTAWRLMLGSHTLQLLPQSTFPIYQGKVKLTFAPLHALWNVVVKNVIGRC